MKIRQLPPVNPTGQTAIPAAKLSPDSGGQFYGYTIAAGATAQCNIAGSYVFLFAGGWHVNMQPIGGVNTVLYLGVEVQTEVPFSAVNFTNPTAASINIVVWVGHDSVPFCSRTVPPGSLCGPYEGITIIAVTGVPQQLTTAAKLFTAGNCYGFSAAVAAGGGTNNAQNIWVGNSKTYQFNLLAPGASLPLANYDLAAIWIVGTAGDGVAYSVA